MAIRKNPDFTQEANTRKSETGSWMIAAALVGILSTFGVSGTQAQVIVDETFIDDLQKGPATTSKLNPRPSRQIVGRWTA